MAQPLLSVKQVIGVGVLAVSIVGVYKGIIGPILAKSRRNKFEGEIASFLEKKGELPDSWIPPHLEEDGSKAS